MKYAITVSFIALVVSIAALLFFVLNMSNLIVLQQEVNERVKEMQNDQLGAASSSLNFSRPTDSFNYYFIEKHQGLFGIGSSTPWGKFSVEMGTTSVPVLVVGDVGTSSPFFIISSFGSVGIGTSSPATTTNLGVESTGTSTISIHSSDSTKGGCLQFESPTGALLKLYATTSGVAVFESGSCK